jgi:formylmethanofuran dehydrogenase subunit B
MATDIAGAEAAVALARKIGGAIDHAHASALLRDLDVLRSAGWVVTTPLQARARSDLALAVGPGAAWAGMEQPPTLTPETRRRIIHLCPGRDRAAPGAETVGTSPAELPVLLGLLRALANGRPVAASGARRKAIGDVAAALRAARYGVASWSAERLDALSIEMLCGLIDDLNATTRFAGLPLGTDGNAVGVAHACAWGAGFPVRFGFGNGDAAHDPWRFDASRMIASGEADAAVWIASLTPDAPRWPTPIPTVALVLEGTRFANPPYVTIFVARPGIDHDAVLFDAALGTLAAKPATASSHLPHVAEVLTRIAAAC